MASIGNHMKMTATTGLRDTVRRFYSGVLGCESLTSPRHNLDLFEFREGFVLGVFYTDEPDEILSNEDYVKSTWLEIQADDPDSLKHKLIEFGVTKIDYEDTSRFYFQAPGGQVFRVAPQGGGI